MAYKPAMPFAIPFKLLQPVTTNAYGVEKKTFETPEGVQAVFFGSFRTFGGTERLYNDVYTVEDTATVDCWYSPDITANCRVYNCNTGRTFEIIGTPENIDGRNQFMQIKLRAVGGQP